MTNKEEVLEEKQNVEEANSEEIEQEKEVGEGYIEDDTLRAARANEIVKNHMLAAGGIGTIPVPVADIVGLIGVQLNLVRSLSNIYGVKFSKNLAKSSIGALISGLGIIPVAAGISSLIKLIPIVGLGAGAMSMVATSGAITYAMGKVFIQHFESGGTFLDFEPKKVKDYFKTQFKEGKDVVAQKAA